MPSGGGPGTYQQIFKFNAEIMGKENVDQLNRALEIMGQRLKPTQEDFVRLSGALKQFTDQGLTASESLNKIKKGMDEADVAGRGMVNQLRKVIAELRELNNQNNQNQPPGGGGGGGNSGFDRIFGRVGGRVIGAEVLGKMGLPGGGFIGSQLAGGLGLGIGTLAAAGGAFGLYEIGKHVNEVLSYAQAQRNLASEIGVTSSQMDNLTRISEITGVKLDSAAKSVNKLTDEMIKGGSRAREISSILGQLGLDSSVAFEDTDVAVKKIAEGLSHIKDEAERSKLADALGVRELAAVADQLPQLSDKFNVDKKTIDDLAKTKDILNEMFAMISKSWMLTISAVIQWHGQGIETDKSNIHFGESSILMGEDLESEFKRRVAESLPLSEKVDALPGRSAPSTLFGLPTMGGVRGYNVQQYRNALLSYGTPEDRHAEAMHRFDAESKDIERDAEKFDVSGQVRSLSQRKQAENERYEHEKKAINQVDELRNLVSTPVTDSSLKSSVSTVESLIRRYPDATRLPEGRRLLRLLIDKSFNDVQSFRFTDWVNTHRKDYEAESMRTLSADLEAQKFADDEALRGIRSSVYPIGKDAGTQMIQARGIAEITNAGAKFAAGERKAAFSSYGLTPQEIARAQYAMSRTTIEQETANRVQNIQAEAGISMNAANRIGGVLATSNFPNTEAGRMERSRLEEEKARYEAEAQQKLIEARAVEIDGLTKANDALAKFNESVDRAAEKVRDEVSGSIVDIMLGAQRGAYTGRGGQGAANAARGFAEKLEGQILTNVVGHVLFPAPGQGGAGGVLSGIGKSLPPWLTKGTIFQPIDEKKPLIDNTAALIDLTATIKSLKVGGPAAGGGLLNSSGTGLNPLIFSPGVDLSGYGSSGGTGVANDISSMANAAAVLAGATGGSAGQQLASVASTLGKLGTLTAGLGAGAKLAGSKSFGILFGGEGATTSVKVGAALGDVGLGIGAAEGALTMAHGGAKNVTAGASEAAMAIAPFTGPAAPFVAAGAAVLGMISSFLPDPRVLREQQISKRIFTQQYLAPPTENLTESSGGTFSDYDIFGNVRTSNFSPYPQSHLPYLDVPRRTAVPGYNYAQFGGPNAVTSALTPAPTYNITIHAVDSQSILNRAPDIVDAFHKGIKAAGHPVINEIGVQLGTR